jgi:squalene-hopene/tetraprenyl-beta-curcumene cyclase
MLTDQTVIEGTLDAATTALLSARLSTGHWEGELSSSALSTATTVCALSLYERAERGDSPVDDGRLSQLIEDGFGWLADHQNEDGGWGDTVDSPSNISTSTLCWAAFGANGAMAGRHLSTAEKMERYLRSEVGELTARRIGARITEKYGNDRTFSVPILTMCALSGRFGEGKVAWRGLPRLPFELARIPHSWFHRLGLPVVSYALPALIAIGQAQHFHYPTGNPVIHLIRNASREKTLKVLLGVQPKGGGFLEAAPLTSFVTMSLVSIGRADHAVARRAIGFLSETVREDGSWPIDTNLVTWATTLSINALAGSGDIGRYLSDGERESLRGWLLDQQYRLVHPYTHAAPGGWAWTDLSGGVPDGDDTPGALVALRHLAKANAAGRVIDETAKAAAAKGIRWLLDLRNRDGGVPTFCRGWGKLPFDRSSPDLTAHAMRAFRAWRDEMSGELQRRIDAATVAAIRYLQRIQRGDGAWVPLWFGNQQEANQENPLYGTSRVLRAGNVRPTEATLAKAWRATQARGVQWVLSAQNEDGGWGAAAGIVSSIEETALAVEALAEAHANAGDRPVVEGIAEAIGRGCAWLAEHTGGGRRFEAAPIGLYFARLWYSERLYPVIFTVSALERVRCLGSGKPS